jgi:hypothetical protein
MRVMPYISPSQHQKVAVGQAIRRSPDGRVHIRQFQITEQSLTLVIVYVDRDYPRGAEWNDVLFTLVFRRFQVRNTLVTLRISAPHQNIHRRSHDSTQHSELHCNLSINSIDIAGVSRNSFPAVVCK